MRKKHEFPGGFDAKKWRISEVSVNLTGNPGGVNFKKNRYPQQWIFFFRENPMYYRYGFRPCDLVQIVAN